MTLTFTLWPWKCIGILYLLMSIHQPSFIKIGWKMTEKSQLPVFLKTVIDLQGRYPVFVDLWWFHNSYVGRMESYQLFYYTEKNMRSIYITDQVNIQYWPGQYTIMTRSIYNNDQVNIHLIGSIFTIDRVNIEYWPVSICTRDISLVISYQIALNEVNSVF